MLKVKGKCENIGFKGSWKLKVEVNNQFVVFKIDKRPDNPPPQLCNAHI